MDGEASEHGGLNVTDVANVDGLGHTPAGKFAPGNRFGKGNPNARRMHELRQQFLDALDAGTVPALAQRLRSDALEGSEFAIKLLLEYAIGKPSQAVELSGPDGESLGLNIGAITTIILGVLSGPEHAEARVRLADQLEAMSDAGD